MKNMYQKLEENIEKIQLQIQQMPAGNFYCTRNGKRYKWYQCPGNGEPPKYIPKSNLDFAQKLAYKKYLTLQLEDFIQKKEAIESYLKKYPNDNQKLCEFSNHPEYKRLLLPNLNKRAQELNKWMDEPAYIQRNYNKLQVYAMHGLIPGKRLITTFEGAADSLDAWGAGGKERGVAPREASNPPRYKICRIKNQGITNKRNNI